MDEAGASQPHADARALARGWCLAREGDPDGALAALPTEGPLSGYAALIAAEALIDLGRADEALELLVDAEAPGHAGRRIRLARGRLLAGYGERRGFADLEALHGTPLEPEARLWQAEAHGIGGDLGEMIESLRTIWIDARPGGWDARAAERLEQLGVAVPELETAGGRQLAEARLSGLHKHHRATEAMQLAELLYEGHTPSDHAGWIELGRVHFAARDYEGALEAWAEVLGPPGSATGDPEELFDYALCHARAGDYDTAAIVYTRLIEAHPGHSKADFGSFKLGYMKYDRRECGAAIAAFEAHRGRYPDSRYLDEALWFGARCHWRQGRIDRALALLGELQTLRPRSSLVSGAAYWQARALGLSGDEAGQRRALQAVLERWPTSGYAWFASQRLGTSFPAKPTVDPPPWPRGWADRDAVQHAEALLSVGLRRFAIDELDTLPRPREVGAALAMAWARLRAGEYRAAGKLACPHAAKPWRDGDRVAQQACLPRPEHDIVSRYAEPYGLDPAIAYGVMWAESLLQPQVTSAVGARGLMQLMPEVGGELHHELFPARPYDPDDLYLGPYNAALGTTELGQRLRSLDGTLDPDSAPAVIASYNGGEEAVRRWLEEAEVSPPPFDAWSEDVGYTETRRYIKRVLGHVMSYRWLYGDPELH
ncbi:MAG TPA: tetratricopeptide repeat protein [Deltaproteobacteria bacterium]|nr:tetratricopeptide repeat protein [Deltaproteobacteria bacterium]